MPADGHSIRGPRSCWCRSQLEFLAASICGAIAFLIETGLPRLHHPLFDAEGFERVSEDAFVLALVRPETTEGRHDALVWLRQAGAQLVEELEQ